MYPHYMLKSSNIPIYRGLVTNYDIRKNEYKYSGIQLIIR